ncbi:MAG: hypothetical protein AB2L11_04745 [Syntrophobacteraceae bacterium]
MEVIFYSGNPGDFSSDLLERVAAVVPSEKVVVCRNLERLQGSLLDPDYDPLAAILVASGQQDLLDFVSIADLLHSVRIIMILHEWEGESISRAHLLKPRFLTSSSANSGEVVAVLRKILGNEEKRQRLQ